MSTPRGPTEVKDIDTEEEDTKYSESKPVQNQNSIQHGLDSEENSHEKYISGQLDKPENRWATAIIAIFVTGGLMFYFRSKIISFYAAYFEECSEDDKQATLAVFHHVLQQLFDGELWDEIHIFFRCILFPICLISYFDTFAYKYTKSVFEILWHPFANIVRIFLDLSFTLFWPTGQTTHKWLMHAIVFLSILCVSILDLFVRIKDINMETPMKKWSDFFYWIKIVRLIAKLHTFSVAILLVYNFFSYHQDYQQINPWNKYRRQYSKTKSLAGEYIIIILFLFISLFFEAYFIEYDDKLKNSQFYDVLYAFICGNWRDIFIPIFTYPLETFLIFLGLLSVNYGRNIMKGLLTYWIIMTSHRTILTILSLIVVWEIKHFDKELEHFTDDIFTTTDQDKIKNRFNNFETKTQQMKLLKTKLFWIIHFIMLERVVFIFLDFYNFFCATKNNWSNAVFLSRHLFQVALIGWVFNSVASFNRKYPGYMIKRLNVLRLKHFIESRNNKDDKETQIQNEREFKLWLKYIEQDSFKRDFTFELVFGMKIDAKWFGGVTMLQTIFMLVSKYNSGAHQDDIDHWREMIQC